MKNKSVVVLLFCTVIFVAFAVGFLTGRTVGSSNVLVSYSNSSQDSTSANIVTSDIKIDINTADFSLLCELPGIGPKLAERILEYRNSNGSFQSIDDLTNISGIGEKLLQSLKDFISVGG